jgi:hypothetical protein
MPVITMGRVGELDGEIGVITAVDDSRKLTKETAAK